MAPRRAGATGNNLDWRLPAAGSRALLGALLAGPAVQLTCSLTGQASNDGMLSSPSSTITGKDS